MNPTIPASREEWQYHERSMMGSRKLPGSTVCPKSKISPLHAPDFASPHCPPRANESNKRYYSQPTTEPAGGWGPWRAHGRRKSAASPDSFHLLHPLISLTGRALTLLKLLCNTEPRQQTKAETASTVQSDVNTGGGARLTPAAREPLSRIEKGFGTSPLQGHNHNDSYTGGWDDGGADGDDDGEVPEDEVWDSVDPPGAEYLNDRMEPQSGRQNFDRNCTRTIQLLGLAEGTTHADIAAVVRGGLILDIYLRTHDRTATVSFLKAPDARTFFHHVKRHDLYIKNKRVCSVLWPGVLSCANILDRSRYAGTIASSSYPIVSLAPSLRGRVEILSFVGVTPVSLKRLSESS